MNTTHFTIVTVDQGTDSWREWRHKGIGASDASTIMGENRFKSSAQLLQEKRGPARDFGQNAAMARGTELEPEARKLYVAKTGRDVRPACLQSTRYDWLRASLDGLALNYDERVSPRKQVIPACPEADMPRPLRIEFAGAAYHVMARGNQGQAIYQDDKDRQRFLETLGHACEKTGWRIHAYALMGNHGINLPCGLLLRLAVKRADFCSKSAVSGINAISSAIAP